MTYSKNLFQIDRPSPLIDIHLQKLTADIISQNIDMSYSTNFYSEFLDLISTWILSSNLNSINGIEKYTPQLMHGCTHFIDSLYMQGPTQVLVNDYRYHARLGNALIKNHYTDLLPNVPLILSDPFPSTGSSHIDIGKILNFCTNKNIDVHIDAAWFTNAKNTHIDATHPSIKSIGTSLSKGLGLGWNRIGVRWVRQVTQDAITIANQFNMINRVPCIIARHFINNTQPDHLWNAHRDRYYQVCNDFELTPTDTIYIALNNGNPVGISKLIQYLENFNRNNS